MILLIEIGNSNFKWCFRDGETLSEVHQFNYNIDSLDELFLHLLNEVKQFTIEKIFICCVAPELIKSQFTNWLKLNSLPLATFFESSENEMGVLNCYKEVKLLGNDRWLSLVYVYNVYQTDVCVIDCGTAITVDLVLKNGQHKGGLIAPGFLSQISALKLNTDIIDQQKFVNQATTPLLQNNTHLCIEQGCRRMSLGFLKESVGILKQQYGENLKIVITGGDSESLISELPNNWHHCPNLLFLGLNYWAN